MYGDITLEKIYTKICNEKHIMHKYQAFGISNQIIEMLKKTQIKIIKITYINEIDTKIYISTLKQYIESEIKELNPIKKGDYQKFVPIKEMIRIK